MQKKKKKRTRNKLRGKAKEETSKGLILAWQLPKAPPKF
jgi:hypothetical protein